MAKLLSRPIDAWALGRLVHNLARFLDGQLKAQEGWGLNAKGAIVHLRPGVFILHWKELPDLHLEPLGADEIERPTGFGPLLPAHPANLDLSGYDLTDEPRLPMDVPYSISGGILAGRAGRVRVIHETDFEDFVNIMS